MRLPARWMCAAHFSPKSHIKSARYYTASSSSIIYAPLIGCETGSKLRPFRPRARAREGDTFFLKGFLRGKKAVYFLSVGGKKYFDSPTKCGGPIRTRGSSVRYRLWCERARGFGATCFFYFFFWIVFRKHARGNLLAFRTSFLLFAVSVSNGKPVFKDTKMVKSHWKRSSWNSILVEVF